MKILVACRSEGRAKQIADGVLRLAGRTGYDFKLFVPRNQRRKYLEAVKDANYNWYLAIDSKAIETKLPPFAYALKHGYDLLVTIPDTFTFWVNDPDAELADFASAIGQARLQFGAKPRKRIERMRKGVLMERVQ